MPTNPSSMSTSNCTEPRGKCLIRMALCLEFPNEDEGSYGQNKIIFQLYLIFVVYI